MGNGIQVNNTQKKIIISNSFDCYINKNISNSNINKNRINNINKKQNENAGLKPSCDSSQSQLNSINSLNTIQSIYNNKNIALTNIQNNSNNQINSKNINGVSKNFESNNQNKNIGQNNLKGNNATKTIGVVISLSYFGAVTSRVLYHHIMPNGLFDFVASRFTNTNEQQKIAKKIIELLHDYELKEKENDSCAICVSDFEIGEMVTMIPCSHLFHSECIKKWLMINLSCPICKFKIKMSSFEGN